MSVLDRMKAKIEGLKEQGVDLSPTSNSIIVKAGEVTQFPAQFEGEACTGAIQTENIRLIEASRRPQQAGGMDSGSGDWLAVLELTFCLENAVLGIIDEGEFVALPHYDDPEFSGMTNQRPLFFGQLMRADAGEEGDGGALAAFKELLDASGYIPRQIGEDNAGPDLTECPPKMRTRWSLEAGNRQSGRYNVDLVERVANGLDVVNFTIVPPNPDRSKRQRPDAEVFEDMIQAFDANLDRAAEGQASDDAEVQQRSRKLISSLSGAVERANNQGELRVYAQRATVPELTVSRQVGAAKWTTDSFTFWSNSKQNA